jgi:hypothetical protein
MTLGFLSSTVLQVTAAEEWLSASALRGRQNKAVYRRDSDDAARLTYQWVAEEPFVSLSPHSLNRTLQRFSTSKNNLTYALQKLLFSL